MHPSADAPHEIAGRRADFELAAGFDLGQRLGDRIDLSDARGVLLIVGACRRPDGFEGLGVDRAALL